MEGQGILYYGLDGTERESCSDFVFLWLVVLIPRLATYCPILCLAYAVCSRSILLDFKVPDFGFAVMGPSMNCSQLVNNPEPTPSAPR